MFVHITKSCFQRNGAKVPNILKRGTDHDLPDDEAEALIDKGYAVEATKSAVDPKVAREKELKKLDAEGLDKVLADKKLPVEGKKNDKIAAILKNEFPSA